MAISKQSQKRVAEAIRKMIDDKDYIKNQIKSGKAVDPSKLKSGKIVKVTI